MRVMMTARLAEECQEQRAEHVEGGHAGSDHAHPVHPRGVIIGSNENLVFTEVAEVNGNPEIARLAQSSVINVIGACFRRPPIFLRSCSPLNAWITLPAPRNSSAL